MEIRAKTKDIDLVEAIYYATYNPFAIAPCFYIFYEKLKNVDNNLLLAPLVLPLYFRPIWRNPNLKIKKVNEIETNTPTFWQERFPSKSLIGLQKDIDHFKDLTSESLQLAIARNWLAIDTDNLSIGVYQKCNTTLEKEQKQIIKNMTKLLSNKTCHEIYSFLGVKP